jgi:hypothetical protein
MEGETTNKSLRAMDVGALTTPRNVALAIWKRRRIVEHLDRLAPFAGTARVAETTNRSGVQRKVNICL